MPENDPTLWVVVPREPTPEMVSDGFDAIRMEEKWPTLLDRVYRAMLAAAPSPVVEGGWQPIADIGDSLPVLVSRPDDREVYRPTTAFLDVTGVWRVYRSDGGMTPLPFEPTHWMPLPPAPVERDAQGVTGGAEPCPACLGEGCGVCNERGAA